MQALDYYLEGKTSESLKKISTAIDTDPASGDYHVFRLVCTTPVTLGYLLLSIYSPRAFISVNISRVFVTVNI